MASIGPFCDLIGLTKVTIDEGKLPTIDKVSNGVALELKCYCDDTLKNRNDYAEILKKLHPSFSFSNISSISSKLERLKEKKKKLASKKKVKGYKNLIDLLNADFIPPVSVKTSSCAEQIAVTTNKETTVQINHEIKNQETQTDLKCDYDDTKCANELKYKINLYSKHVKKLENKMSVLKIKLQNVKNKLGHYSVKNTNKRDETDRHNLHKLRNAQRTILVLQKKIDSSKLMSDKLCSIVQENHELRNKLDTLSEIVESEKVKKIKVQKANSYLKNELHALKNFVQHGCEKTIDDENETINNTRKMKMQLQEKCNMESEGPQAKKPKLSEPEDVSVKDEPGSTEKEWLPVTAESVTQVKSDKEAQSNEPSEMETNEPNNTQNNETNETVVKKEISETVGKDTNSEKQKTETGSKLENEIGKNQEVSNGKNVECGDSVKTEEVEPVEKHHVKETDVGILEYISPFAGFQGVIKQRYSDFLVNEISMDGRVVHLTNTEIPKEPVDPVPVLEYKIPPGLLSEEEITKLKELQQSSREEKKSVLISVGNDREYRSKIHNAISQGFPGLDSSTITRFHEKFIEATLKSNKGKGNGLRNWPKNRGDYCKFSFYKEAQDTMNAVGILSNKLRLKHSVFQYAGTKDKRSKSTQEVTAYRVAAEKLVEANRFMRNIVCGDFCYTDSKLSLGQLKGNKFTIVLRSVTGTEEQIASGMKSLSDIGFVNYYGMQRFGTFSIPTHHIGRALLSGNWKEAVELILKPRHGEGIMVTQIRERWWRTRDSKEAAAKMPKNSHIERCILLALAKNPNDYMGAIQKVPRSSRTMYVHAYQSYIWNCVVSHRIKQFGVKPVCGDLVIPHKQYIQTEDTEAETVEEKETTDKPSSTDKSTSDTLTSDKSTTDKSSTDTPTSDTPTSDKSTTDKSSTDKSKSDKPSPIIVDESNIDSYTIYDVVLPKPGYDVIYPGNDLELLYKNMMEKDGLDYQNMKTKYKDYSLSGDYRHIVAKPDDVDYKLFKYNDVNIPLALSDYDKMKGEAEPQSIEDGANLALRIEMTLPTSSYATMALRELLKIDTSSNHQASLNST